MYFLEGAIPVSSFIPALAETLSGANSPSKLTLSKSIPSVKKSIHIKSGQKIYGKHHKPLQKYLHLLSKHSFNNAASIMESNPPEKRIATGFSSFIASVSPYVQFILMSDTNSIASQLHIKGKHSLFQSHLKCL